jgi:hypothetical protein
VRVFAAIVVLGAAVLAVARNPFLPFPRLLEDAPAAVHVADQGQAARYVALYYEGTHVSCGDGVNGWTYLCSFTDTRLQPARAGVFVEAGVVRDQRVFLSGGPIAGPQPPVSTSEYVAAARKACADRRTLLEALPRSYVVDPEQSRAAAQLVLEAEQQIEPELYAAGNIRIPGPAGGNVLYGPFSDYVDQLRVLAYHAADVQVPPFALEGAIDAFNRAAARLGIDCVLP